MTTTELRPMAGVRLVAGRELSTRLRSKAYRITILVSAVVLVGVVVVLKFLHHGSSTTTVGLTPQTAPLAAAIKASGDAVGRTIDTTTVPDQNTGQTEVSSGDLDALLLADGTKFRVIVKKSLDSTVHTAMDLLAQQVALDQQITQLGGDPAKVLSTTRSAGVEVTTLQPARHYDGQRIALGAIAGVLIYMSLLITGQGVAQGVVEEKSSRVVEILLATLRPWQLMAGKVLGLGLVGLIQVALIGGAGLAAGLGTGVLTISASAAAGTIGWLIVWYLLGFAMYSVVFGGLGALVSRQEDIPGAVFPASIFVIAGYVLGISILPSNPSSPLIEVLSVIPMFAPTTMPMRLAMGGVPAWEAILSVVLALAMIPLLIWLSARIYRNAVLRTGARVKLSQALGAA